MNTLQDIGSKIKKIPAATKEKLFYMLVILFVALLAFGLGRLSALYGGSDDFKVVYPPQAQGVPSGGGEYVASKTGTSYFFPWCTAAFNIPEENKVYFESTATAEAAGYSAGNCKGLR